MRVTGLGVLVLFASTSWAQSSLVGTSPQMGRVEGVNGAVTVTLPLKMEFSVWDRSDYTDTRCDLKKTGTVFVLTVEGFGTATHLGMLTTRMTFCFDVSNGDYWDVDGSFVAANGDNLFFTGGGKVVPNEGNNSDYYQERFDDLFEIIGGSGRFEGASGSFNTNAWVHTPPADDVADQWRTDFFSAGNINVVRGRR